MAQGVTLHVWGDYACFTRPEARVERMSYDVMTPSAARGILEAIHWKPAIRWIIDRIHVLKPIQFQSIRRNEVGSKISDRTARAAMARGSLEGLNLIVDEDRQQRAMLALKDVGYVIEAHFVLTDKAGPEDGEAKHIAMFNRRAEKGQCFHRPCLGMREFAASFAPAGDAWPKSTLPVEQRDRDLGWMLYDFDYAHGNAARLFQARLAGGVLDLTSGRPEGFAS
jgi:CRISPR-associated protein Cas5d